MRYKHMHSKYAVVSWHIPKNELCKIPHCTNAAKMRLFDFMLTKKNTTEWKFVCFVAVAQKAVSESNLKDITLEKSSVQESAKSLYASKQ